jgi:hypothetical protein
MILTRQNRQAGQGYQLNPIPRCPLPFVGRCYQAQCPAYVDQSYWTDATGEIWVADPGRATKIERGGCRLFNTRTCEGK